MLHPSYVDLMKVVNKDVEEGEEPVISSRYSVVMATAKRARQIIAGDEPLVKTKAKEKPLSIAVRELNEGQIRILTDEEREAMEARMQAEAEAEEQKPANTETEENNN
jgi:DNA-directed RNA polymerase subunit omega